MTFRNKFPGMRHFMAAAAVGLLLATAGCASADPKHQTPCPETGLMLDATHLTAFDPPATTDANKAVLTARIDNYRGACRMRDNGALEFVLDIEIGGRKGPAASKDLERAQFPYFIAVLGPNEDVLQRQSFQSRVMFNKDGHGFAVEKHTLRLPMEDKKSIRQHKVVIGFELTPEQLAFNRSDDPAAPKAAEKAERPAAKKKKK